MGMKRSATWPDRVEIAINRLMIGVNRGAIPPERLMIVAKGYAIGMHRRAIAVNRGPTHIKRRAFHIRNRRVIGKP